MPHRATKRQQSTITTLLSRKEWITLRSALPYKAILGIWFNNHVVWKWSVANGFCLKVQRAWTCYTSQIMISCERFLTDQKGRLVPYLLSCCQYELYKSFPTVCCAKSYKTRQIDVETAFLNGDLEEEVYTKVANGAQAERDMVCEIRRSLYRLKQAATVWCKTIRTDFADLNLIQSRADPVRFASFWSMCRKTAGSYRTVCWRSLGRMRAW